MVTGPMPKNPNATKPKAKTAGARVISSGGGPVELKDGKRAVLLRDPDVGGFVELLESP